MKTLQIFHVERALLLATLIAALMHVVNKTWRFVVAVVVVVVVVVSLTRAAKQLKECSWVLLYKASVKRIQRIQHFHSHV